MVWVSFQSIAIMLAVVFIIASITSAVAPGLAADSLSALKGMFGFGEPSIASFSVTKIDEKSFGSGYAISAGKYSYKQISKVVVRRHYKRYPHQPDADMKEKELEGLSLGTVFSAEEALRDSEGGIGPEAVLIADPDIVDSKGGGGIHRFTIEVFLTNGNVLSDDVELRLYDKDYVEEYQWPVDGNQDYNVKQCKLDQLKREILSDAGSCNEGVTILYRQDVGKLGPVGVCNYPSLGSTQSSPLFNVEFTGCFPPEIDDAHSKVGPLTFYRFACERGDNIKALTEFRRLVTKLAKNGETVETIKRGDGKGSIGVLDALTQCTNRFETYLQQQGWIPVSDKTVAFQRWEAYDGNITAYLDSFDMPNLDNKIIWRDNEGRIYLGWNVPVGKNNVGRFEITHVVRRTDTDSSQEILPPAQPNGQKNCGKQYCYDFRPEPGNRVGWHEITVTAVSSADEAKRSEPLAMTIGLYNRRFIELFESLSQLGCGNDCNVIKEKKEFIKDYIRAGEVYEQESVKNSIRELGCVYDASDGMNSCEVPGAVDLMYREIMEFQYPNAEQREELSGFSFSDSSSCSESSSNPGKDVCRAKRKLTEQLVQKAWVPIVIDTPFVITPSDVKVQDFMVYPRADGTVLAQWVISGDKSEIGGFEIEHQFYRDAESGRKGDFKRLLPISIEDAAAAEAVLGPFDDGYHEFRLKAVDAINYEIHSSTPQVAGLSSDNYIELYEGEADKCRDYRIHGDESCDIIGNKREFLRHSRFAVDVYNENEQLRNELAAFGCSFSPSDASSIDTCRPEAVQPLFEAAIKKQYASEAEQDRLLTLDCLTENGRVAVESVPPTTPPTWDYVQTSYHSDLLETCKARKNLAETLKGLGWAKVEDRENIQAVPTSTIIVDRVFVKTVPEHPLPGELFSFEVEVEANNPVKWMGIMAEKETEWNDLSCDWLNNYCKREWKGLYDSGRIDISIIDSVGQRVNAAYFDPVASGNCLENHWAGEQWVGCISENQEEVLYKCNEDGSAAKILPEERRYFSFICGGNIDYGNTGATSQGECIYQCRLDIECRAAGGSIAPLSCPDAPSGYRGLNLQQVCCESTSVQETNPKSIAVLSILVNVMDAGIESNRIGGFFFVFDAINLVKMFTEAQKTSARYEKLNVLKRFLAEAEQGNRLSAVIGTMHNLKENQDEMERFLARKYDRIRAQVTGLAFKLEQDKEDESLPEAVRNKARDDFLWLNNLQNHFDALYAEEQKRIDKLAISESEERLFLLIARYDALTWNDDVEVDERQFEVLDDIYFELAEFLKARGDDGIAINMYNLVTENFPASDHYQEALDRVNALESWQHKTLTLTKQAAIDIFGDPLFFAFGGPKALVEGGLTGVKVVSKSPQAAKQLYGTTAELSQTIANAARQAGASSPEKIGQLLQGSRGLLTKAVREELKIILRSHRIFQARVVVNNKGQWFEAVAMDGKKVRMPLTRIPEELTGGTIEQLSQQMSFRYSELMRKFPQFMDKVDDQKNAMQLLQGGFTKDEIGKILLEPGKISDEILTKYIGTFLEPIGITDREIAKVVIRTKSLSTLADKAAAGESLVETVNLFGPRGEIIKEVQSVRSLAGVAGEAGFSARQTLAYHTLAALKKLKSVKFADLQSRSSALISDAHRSAVAVSRPFIKFSKKELPIIYEDVIKGVLIKHLPLETAVGIDVSKASIKTAEQFAGYDKIAPLAIPILVVGESGEEEVQYIVFEDINLDFLKTDTLFTPDGNVHLCVFHGVLVDCVLDDYVSRTAIPLDVVNRFDNAVLLSLNEENIADFRVGKDVWTQNRVVPLLIALDDGYDAAEGKAGEAYDAVADLRAKGLSDIEVQSLLLSAEDLDELIQLKNADMETIRGIIST